MLSEAPLALSHLVELIIWIIILSQTQSTKRLLRSLWLVERRLLAADLPKQKLIVKWAATGSALDDAKQQIDRQNKWIWWSASSRRSSIFFFLFFLLLIHFNHHQTASGQSERRVSFTTFFEEKHFHVRLLLSFPQSLSVCRCKLQLNQFDSIAQQRQEKRKNFALKQRPILLLLSARNLARFYSKTANSERTFQQPFITFKQCNSSLPSILAELEIRHTPAEKGTCRIGFEAILKQWANSQLDSSRKQNQSSAIQLFRCTQQLREWDRSRFQLDDKLLRFQASQQSTTLGRVRFVLANKSELQSWPTEMNSLLLFPSSDDADDFFKFESGFELNSSAFSFAFSRCCWLWVLHFSQLNHWQQIDSTHFAGLPANSVGRKNNK